MIEDVKKNQRGGATRERIAHDPRELALALVRKFGGESKAIAAVGGIHRETLAHWLRGGKMSAALLRHVLRLLGRQGGSP